jgi:phenylacetate-CoA ligase
MSSSLQQELTEQQRWYLRPNYLYLQDQLLSLVRNEFVAPGQQLARQLARLQRLLVYSGTAVPYYRDLFARLKFDPQKVHALAELAALPLLERRTVQERGEQLHTEALPEGVAPGAAVRTSGTSGQPVEILRTRQSLLAAPLMKQREYRWFRFDPQRTFASIRNAPDLPRVDGALLEPGKTLKGSAWAAVGGMFHTGPWLGLSDATPADEQVAWLEHHEPTYLLGQSALMEQLAFAYDGRESLQNLAAIETVSQQLTAEMRFKLENAFGVPVHQNYGLNEVGIVAIRCPEGGRYHVHSELCMVEIVDENGLPCRPGEQGRLLVTAFNNPAMPLIRYDTDDLAEPVDGPCPCGRTLPSFRNVHGRYRRTVQCPPETWRYWAAIMRSLDYASRELVDGLRQYQLHQYLDKRYELRLVTATKPPKAFEEHVQAAWQKVAEGEPPQLSIRYVDTIERPQGGKFQNFTSDFASATAMNEE